MPRKRLLLAAMAGFAVANTVTAGSASYPLTMAARFPAGVAAGLAWTLLAGYARRHAVERGDGGRWRGRRSAARAVRRGRVPWSVLVLLVLLVPVLAVVAGARAHRFPVRHAGAGR